MKKSSTNNLERGGLLNKKLGVRTAIIIVIFSIIVAVFGVRLFQVQITDSENYRSLVGASYVRTVSVPSTRGEIYDRNGIKLVSNKTSYNVIFDKAYIDNSVLNQVILNMTELLTKTGEEWIDGLDISKTVPFVFTSDGASVAYLKTFLELQPHATAENCMDWLIDLYGLEDYSPEQARVIAGVRYKMSYEGYSLTSPYTFAKNVSYNTALIIEENNALYGNVYVEEAAIREYIAGDLASSIIGVVGSMTSEQYLEYKELGYKMNDVIGQFGIEALLETQLRGTAGTREITLDSMGNILSVEDTVAPVAGNSVYLTIDSKLQRVLQNSLADTVEAIRKKSKTYGYEAEGGAAVVVKVKTGELLAAANYPTFDLSKYYSNYSEYANDPLFPLYNRAFSGLYAPGSCFKPVTAATAITADLIDIKDHVYCGQVYTHFTDYQPTCMYHHGNINLSRALSVSCNIYFFEAGLRAGIQRLVDYATQFGLGQPTGLELPEKIGRMASPEMRELLGGKWQAGDILQASIGQSDSQFSPLQLAMYTATLANNGERMSANVIQKLTSYDGSTTEYETMHLVASTVDADESVFKAIRAGMVEASTTGTARAQFAYYPIKVASKTGTPENGDGTCDAVFIAYAPANDPEIAIAVVVENGYQGYTAAPVAKTVFDYYFGYGVSDDMLIDDSQMEGLLE